MHGSRESQGGVELAGAARREVHGEPPHPEVRDAYREAVREAVAARIPLAAALFVILLGLASVFEYANYPNRRAVLLGTYAAEVAVCAAWVALARARQRAMWIASFSGPVLIMFCMATYFLLARTNAETLLIGLTLSLAGVQVVLPWGLAGQATVSAGALAAMGWALAGGAHGSLSPSYTVLLLGIGAALTCLGAHLLERHRFDVFRRTAELERAHAQQREEAALSSAMLRISDLLHRHLADPHALVQQLVSAARDALGADWAIAYLWVEPRQVYRFAAADAAAQGLIEEIRSVEFGRDAFPLIRALERESLLQIPDRDEQSLVPPELLRRWRVRSMLCSSIRLAREPIGALAVGYTDRSGPFSRFQVRLLSGIAQQTALALQNARLMEAARTADRAKSEFVATMSHELRTPLNVILGYVDLLREGLLGALTPEQEHALARMQDRSLHLLELITATLDLNRLESGYTPLRVEHFSIGELLSELRDGLPRGWLKPAVQMVWDDSGNSILMRSDRGKVEMALRNLIHNALKYTDSGKVRIEVAFAPEKRFVDFRVKDTGLGIAPDELKSIFEMFHQAKGVGPRGQGVGLGLYIVKRLADALGGSVWAESTPGRGSCFTLRLPLDLAHLGRTE